MSTICCLPGCDNRFGDCTLFKMPSKKFLSGDLFTWAEKLEIIILRYRADAHIKHLFKRDCVRMCEKHFSVEDIIMKGTRKELKTGALPTLYLPVKSNGQSTIQKFIRPPPKNREDVPKVHNKNFNFLRKNLSSYRGWTSCSTDLADTVWLSMSDGHDQPKYRVEINKDLQVTVFYYGWRSEVNFDMVHNTVGDLLRYVECLAVCKGSCESATSFRHIITKRPEGTDNNMPVILTVCSRSKDCEVFLTENLDQVICFSCQKLKRNEEKNSKRRASYLESVREIPSKKIHLGRSLPSRISQTICAKETEIKNLEKRVNELLSDASAVVVDECVSKDLQHIMQEATKNDEVDDFYSIFWREQKKLNNLAATGARYHPEIIRFCLSLASKSASAYEELRQSGILRLPSSRTLCDYRNVFHTSPGLQPHVLDLFETCSKNLTSRERYVVLSLDEMKVKENLVYSDATDEMVGFVDLGKSRGKKEHTLATHALQLYVRSVAGSFSRPLAFYSTCRIKSDQLASIFWEAVGALHQRSFIVLALVADGASCNRKMFSLLNNMELDIPYKCINIYNPELPIFLISDPPHLLKTTCNNIRSSRPGGSRLLKYGEHYILWEHFCRVPRLFKSTELRCCKLTSSHFSNQSFAKMRVSYAAQLLSRSVSKLMEKRGGNEMVRSAWLAGLMNKWFDLMNTRLQFGYNTDLKPYSATDDERLSWLTDVFLVQLQQWRDSLKGSPEERAKKFLSHQTYDGLVGATKAVVELVRFSISHFGEGVYVLTKRVNQDPLKAYFGQMRQIGRRSEAPDIKQYSKTRLA